MQDSRYWAIRAKKLSLWEKTSLFPDIEDVNFVLKLQLIVEASFMNSCILLASIGSKISV
jgi:hypothetical protein